MDALQPFPSGQIIADKKIRGEVIIEAALITANYYSSFRGADQAAYIVPTGKTLVVEAVEFYSNSAAAPNASMKMGYGDASVFNNSTPPAGFSWIHNGDPIIHTTAAWVKNQMITNWEIPADKYPCMLFDAASFIRIYGYLK